MIQRFLVCMFLGGVVWGQAANSGSVIGGNLPAAENSALPPETPVITVDGLCDHSPADKSTDCKTVVTRAEFEEILAAIGPNMPAAARRQLASRYASALAISHKAHEMGLDQGPKYEQLMKIQRLQVTANLVSQEVQQKASVVSDQEINDYYNKNLATYDEVDFERLFIPRNKQLEAPKVKLTDAANQKRQQDATAAMKTEADALQARAVAGEDFAKLQAEAYTFAGLKSTPPTQKVSKARRNSLPPAQASVFDLKAGEVSPVISDMSGYFVYKVLNKETLPLTQVHDEIFGSLKSEKVQAAMKDLQNSATPKLNDEYFGPAAASGANMPAPSLPPRPGPKPPTLGPK